MNARVLISGFVQGVGFRHFVRKKALELELTGWVRNLPDSRVEAVFQSSASSDQEAKEKIEEMIQFCKKGPFLAEVEGVVVDWQKEDRQFSDFTIQ
ncbi:MAG: acylphosphatase [Candidatus Levybacteria bacterium]|nr:acylphosphatase [Candidatus Levybacteria bacterium]MBI2622676.1 acylphosphatase [Candidatus Levybacteria bacterium]